MASALLQHPAKGMVLDTPEEVREKWVRTGWSTAPVDRPVAEMAIAEAYRAAGLACPGDVVWMDGPVSAAALQVLLSARDTGVRLDEAALFRNLGRGIVARVRDRMAGIPSLRLGPGVGSVLADRVVRGAVVGIEGKLGSRQMHSHLGSPGRTPRAMAIGRVLALLWDTVRYRTNLLAVGPCCSQFDIGRFALLDGFLDRKGYDFVAPVRPVLAVAQTVGWLVPFERTAIAVERPRVLRADGYSRLHDSSGKAIEYGDGWGAWFWHGIRVPRKVIEEPEAITVEDIDRQANVEIRRVMIERFGRARHLQESGSQLIHEDECGRLYRKPFRNAEPAIVLRVVNSTPEPDGTRKEYWLRVPPEVRTAREAVAWTFGISANEYEPAAET